VHPHFLSSLLHCRHHSHQAAFPRRRSHPQSAALGGPPLPFTIRKPAWRRALLRPALPSRRVAGACLPKLGACAAVGGRSFGAALAGARHQQRLGVPVGCEVLAVRQQLAAPAKVRRLFAACCCVGRCTCVFGAVVRAGCACGICASCLASTAGSTRSGKVLALHSSCTSLSLGLAQQLVADPSGQHLLAQGTSRGCVCLWDVRFLLCVNSWQHPQR
jgi:hypothetical protein